MTSTATTIPLSSEELTSLALILTARVENGAAERRTFALDAAIAALVLSCAERVLSGVSEFQQFVNGGIAPRTIKGIRDAATQMREDIADAGDDGIVAVYPRHGGYLTFAVKLIACLHEVEES